MTEPEPKPDAPPSPLELGEALAAQIGGQEWVLDAEDLTPPPPLPETGRGEESSAPFPLREGGPGGLGSSDIPLAEAAVEPEVPPTPLQIIEAMLFVGGAPLKPARAAEIVRGLSPEQFRESVEVLNRVYRLQNRPYHIVSTEQGCTLSVRPRYRSLREKIFGGPREARLTQSALDVLALVAYRQPAAKAEIDSVRGVDSGHVLRQLVRLGLIVVVQRAEAKQREVSYGTTARFLDLFNLRGLDDLPQTGDPQRL